MGLFSSKKTYVESLSMPLVEDTPNYIQQSVITSITNERPIVDDLIANTIRGLGAKLSTYFKYGRDNYIYGVPTGTLTHKSASNTVVKNVIESEIGESINLIYVEYGGVNAEKFAEEYLINTRGWDSSTGSISNPPSGISGSVVLSDSAFTDYSTIELTYTNEDSESFTESITVDSVWTGESYYHVSYYKQKSNGDSDTSTRYWWFYTPYEDTYVVLEPYSSISASYMPIVPLRRNKVSLTSSDDAYETSKKLLDKLDLDIDDLLEGVNESDDISYVENAYVVLGVSTQTESDASKKYLYSFFKYLETVAAYTEDDYTRWLSLSEESEEYTNYPSMNNLVIKESGSFNTELGFLYIKSTTVIGSIGSIGKVTTSTTVRDPKSVGEGSQFETSSLYIRKQLTSTTYEQLEVVGLKHINHIYKSYSVETTLENAVDAASDSDDYSDGMLIPLNQQVFASMNMKDKIELAYDSMRIQFNCRVTQKLKWYQTGFFQFAILVVSIAITIYSMGTMAESLATAAALVGSSSLIIGAIVLGVISIGVQYGIAYLTDVLGEEFGVIIATIALIGGAMGYGFSDPLINASVQSGIQNGYQQSLNDAISDVQSQMAELESEINAAQEELDEMYDDISTDSIIDPMVAYATTTGLALPTETPSQYYYTRIHTGNMAEYGSLMIENFVDSNLYLEGTSVHRGIKV